MVKCFRCKTELVEENSCPSDRDRGKGYCHVCRKLTRKPQRVYMAKRYAERRKFLDSIKLEQGCVDCGYKEHPSALQFDHIDPFKKKFKIGSNHSRSLESLLDEIKKCVVRCANCHVIRTVHEGHAKANQYSARSTAGPSPD